MYRRLCALGASVAVLAFLFVAARALALTSDLVDWNLTETTSTWPTRRRSKRCRAAWKQSLADKPRCRLKIIASLMRNFAMR